MEIGSEVSFWHNDAAIRTPYGKRIAAFYLEEAALKIARALRESEWKTVYGCYDHPDGSFLIGLASARAGGKFRQKIALQRLPGPPDASVEVWRTVTAGRISGPLDAFARSCLNTRPFSV